MKMIVARKRQYKIAQNPKNKLWYVLGFCGENYYIPISIGYKIRKDAEQFSKLQPAIDFQSKIIGAACI